MITLKGITWDHPRGYRPLEAASRLYESSRGIRVDWEKRSLTAFGDQSLRELSGSYDLLVIDHPHVGTALREDWLVPLDSVLAAEVLHMLRVQSAGPSFDSYRYGGHQWALPVDAAVQCAAARPDLLGGEPFPRSWEEVFRLGARLRDKNQWVGMALCPTDCGCSFLTLTAQLGSPIREGAERLVDRAKGLEALSMLRKMRDEFHPESFGWNPINLFDHMSGADDTPYAPLAFGYTHYSQAAGPGTILRFADAPGIREALLGGAGIAVSSAGEFIPEAVAYAAWIAEAEVQGGVYVENDGQPGNGAVWENQAANALVGGFFQGTWATLQAAQLRPRYRGWPEFQRKLGLAVHGFLDKDSDPEKLLDELEEAFLLSKTLNAKTFTR